MDVVRFQDAPCYAAANHEQVSAKRLQGGDVTKVAFARVGHSHFPPGAVVPMDAMPFERVYVVGEGELSIDQANGVRHRLRRWDSVFVPAGERRAVVNESGSSAVLIVVTPAG